jgi:hypothetical protein
MESLMLTSGQAACVLVLDLLAAHPYEHNPQLVVSCSAIGVADTSLIVLQMITSMRA